MLKIVKKCVKMKHKKLVEELEIAGYEVNRHSWHSRLYFVESLEKVLLWYSENEKAECINSYPKGDIVSCYENHMNCRFLETINDAVFSLRG
jgi:hypothetical protein